VCANRPGASLTWAVSVAVALAGSTALAVAFLPAATLPASVSFGGRFGSRSGFLDDLAAQSIEGDRTSEAWTSGWAPGRRLQAAAELPQVECQGAHFGLCVCDWANSNTCSIVNNDDSRCWSCCCQAMHPSDYETAQTLAPGRPFPVQTVQTTQPPAEWHPGLQEGFTADEVVRIQQQCATVLGYIGGHKYVARFIGSGQLKAFRDVAMIEDPTCQDPTTPAPSLEAWQFSALVCVCLLLLCGCLTLLLVQIRRRCRKQEDETDDSELDQEAEKAVAADEAAVVHAKTWPAALYDGTLGWLLPSSGVAEEARETIAAGVSETSSPGGAEQAGTWSASLYAHTFGLLSRGAEEEEEASATARTEARLQEREALIQQASAIAGVDEAAGPKSARNCTTSACF